MFSRLTEAYAIILSASYQHGYAPQDPASGFSQALVTKMLPASAFAGYAANIFIPRPEPDEFSGNVRIYQFLDRFYHTEKARLWYSLCHTPRYRLMR